MDNTLTICYEPFVLNLVSNNAYLNGVKLPLTPKEFSLLLGFIKNAGKIISSEGIYTDFWELQITGNYNCLYKTISLLRKKLVQAGCIYTISYVYGKGYCFQKKSEK